MNYLNKFSPTIDVFANVASELDLLTENDRAFKSWEMLLAVKKVHDSSFLLIGCLLKRVRDDKLYIKLDYDNFSQFLASEELGFSREKAYMCIKTYEFYIEYLQLEPNHVGSMNISRLSMMVPVLKEIEDKAEVVRQIESMNELRHNDFVREIKKRVSKDGKPAVFWNEELGKWYIGFYPNTCHLHNLGDFNAGVV